MLYIVVCDIYGLLALENVLVDVGGLIAHQLVLPVDPQRLLRIPQTLLDTLLQVHPERGVCVLVLEHCGKLGDLPLQ